MGHPSQKPQTSKVVNDRRFIQYLQQELGIVGSAIALASRGQEAKVTELPVSLWNYGLIDLDQLADIFNWSEDAA